MSQFSISGPLREAHLGDELGTGPVRRLVRLDRPAERRLGNLQRLQQLPHPIELLLIEACAGVADIDQARALILAEQQRPEARARVARLGPAADHELLLVGQLVLPPGRAAAARLIHRGAILDDQSFPALAVRAFVERPSVGGDLLADPQRAGEMPREIFLERLAPRGQRQPADVLGAGAQQVEGEKRRRLLPIQHVDVALALDVDASLQLLESCRPALGIERHDFPVDEQRRAKRARQRFERPDHGGELRGLFVAEPGPEADVGPWLAGRDMDQRADAVVLRFEEQVLAGQRRFGQRRQHRAHSRGVLSPARHLTMICIVNLQPPIPKLQGTPNPQLPRPWGRAASRKFGSFLGVGSWECVGIWKLELGICRTVHP